MKNLYNDLKELLEKNGLAIERIEFKEHSLVVVLSRLDTMTRIRYAIEKIRKFLKDQGIEVKYIDVIDSKSSRVVYAYGCSSCPYKSLCPFNLIRRLVKKKKS